MSDSFISKLLELQKHIYDCCVEEDSCHLFGFEAYPRISFTKIGNLYEINYFGEGANYTPNINVNDEEAFMNYGFSTLCDLISENDSKIISLNFDAPDKGANGLRPWYFDGLLQANKFDNLVRFTVKRTDPAAHNLVTIDYHEKGMIAKLVAKMPALEHLELPSAPNKTFFDIDLLELTELILHAGSEHQNFIRHLADATNLSNLMVLDYADTFDYAETTPFDDYKSLFSSNFFSKYFLFTLRDPRLTQANLKELLNLKEIQLLHLPWFYGSFVD